MLYSFALEGSTLVELTTETSVTRIGDFRIIGELGSGGMGVVYLAIDEKTGVPAAVKTIRTEHKSGSEIAELRRRIEDEVRNTKKVQSPYVVEILDYNVRANPPWYASRYIAGLNLEQAIAHAGGSLPESTVTDLAFTLRRALEDIHSKGIVHRDLKPGNIILGTDGLRIVDFGIARGTSDPGLTDSGQVVGTATYMCPEQVTGGRPTFGWDIFAFGGLLVYALTGHPPFGTAGMSVFDMMLAIRDSEPNLNGVPASLLPVVKACLEKDPAKRATLQNMRTYLPGSATAPGLSLPPKLNTEIARIKRLAEEETRTAFAKVPPPGPTPSRVGGRAAARRGHSPRQTPQGRQRQEAFDREYARRLQAKQRRRDARKAANKRHPATVTLLWTLALGLLGTGVYERSAILDWLRNNQATDNGAAPAPTRKPTPSPSPSVAKPEATYIPSAHFTKGSLGSMHDPASNKKSITVLDATQYGYDLQVRVRVTGYPANDTSVFKTSCIHTSEKGRSYNTQRSGSYAMMDGDSQTATIRFSLLFDGKASFDPRCAKANTIPLGSNKLHNKGSMFDGENLYMVMAARRVNDTVVVTVPSFTSLNAHKLCLQQGWKAVPASSVRSITKEGSPFYDVTFRSTKGEVHVSCDTSKARPIFNGAGVTVP